MRRPLVVGAALLLSSCSSSAGPGDPESGSAGPLRLTAEAGTIRLRNEAQRPVFYFVYERGAAALINWAACVDAACPSLAPGAQVRVPYSAIGGYAPGRIEAIVWWWEAVSGPADGPVPGTVHAVVARL